MGNDQMRTYVKRLIVLGLVILGSSTCAFAEPPRFGHVEQHGSGDATLILVPCLGCDWRAWDEFMDRNADRYTMYAITWPGMGDTPLPKVQQDASATPHWDYILDAMAALIRNKKLLNPILVGHSAAGPYVVHFAAQYPALVGKVVSVDATIANWDTFGYTPQQRAAWAKSEMKDVRDQYDNDAAWAKLNAPPKGIKDPVRRAMYGRMWTTPPREHVLQYWGEWLETDVGAMLPNVDVPLLAIYAIRSKDKHPDQTRTKRRARFKRAKVGSNITVAFIEQSGHSIWEHQPKLFDAMIADFVNGRNLNP